MSWCDPRPSWRALLIGAGVLALAPALAGCGFQPLYGAAENRPAANAALMQVDIGPIPNRRGQELRNLLIDRFYETDRPSSSRYRVDTNFQAAEQKLALRKDASAERAQLVMNAQYRLVEVATGKTAFQASSRSFISYNIPDDQFSALTLVDSAYRRGMEQIADDMTARIAMFLSKPS